MLVIGLTGGIACGKSTVARIFEEHSIPVLDADAVSRNILDRGKPGYQLVKKLFSPKVLGPDDQIDRNALAEIVFQNQDMRRRLEEITLPLIRAEIDQFIQKHRQENRQAVAVEAAMIIENQRQNFYSLLVVVGASQKEQIKRLQQRNGLSLEKAQARIKAQMPLAEKQKVADHYIDNSSSREKTRKDTEIILSALKKSLRKSD